MKKYTNSSPTFSRELLVVETTDTDYAGNLNAAPIQAFENTLVLKARLDAAATVTRELVIPVEGWKELLGGEGEEESSEEEKSVEESPLEESGKEGGSVENSGNETEKEPSPGGSAEEEGATGMRYVDIPQEGMTESMIPILTILPADTEVAKRCGMATTVRTMEGKLRVYAEQPPETAIRVVLLLLRASTVSGEGIPGEGTGDGTGSGTPGSSTLLPDVATKEEVDEMIEEIFGTENGASVSEVATPEEVEELLKEVFEQDI